MNYIYTLSCPNTGQVRYIGKTNNLSKRLSAHIRAINKCHKTSWIKSLGNNKPIIDVLEEVEHDNEVFNREVYWIAQFKAWGFDLVNSTDGGEGFSGKDVRGENNTNAKITEQTAKAIIKDLKKNIYTIDELTKKYNVNKSTIGNLKYGKSWIELTKGQHVVAPDYKSKRSGNINRAAALKAKGVYKRQSIAVIQCDLDGNTIEEFDSISAAADAAKTNRSSIASCINQPHLFKTANHFKWKKK